MKRAGKCVGKKTFKYRRQAEAQVIKNYCHGHKTYSIYECPTCLDFHLTSTGDNRTAELKKICERTRKKLSYKPVDKRAEYLKRSLSNYVRNNHKPKRKPNQTPPNPNSKTSIAKRKKKEYKESIVPLSQQKLIYAQLNKKIDRKANLWKKCLEVVWRW